MLVVTLLQMIVPILVTIMFSYYNWSDKKKVTSLSILFVILFLIKLCFTYFTLPSRVPLNLLISNLVLGLVMVLLALIIFDQLSDVRPIIRITNKRIKQLIMIGFSVIVLLLLISVAETNLVKKPVYNSLKVEKKASAPKLSKTESPIAIAPKTVRNRMNKAMSTVGNASFYELGDLQTQFYQGKPVYIAPVEYSGLFQAIGAKTLPGYFIISATDINAEPKFINKSMNYSDSSILNHDAARRMYNAFPTWIHTGDPQFEVDDNGTPYYVQTVYHTRNISSRINYDSLHVVLMNAQNGDCQLYKTNEAPKFLDETIDSATARDMIDVYAKDRYGLFNFSNRGKMEVPGTGTEDGLTPVFSKDGHIYYFTDYTSPNSKADSTMGYSMLNARNGKITFYTGKNVGVMDSEGAKELADKEYLAQKWTSSMPIMYNIDGTPTWVISLLDSTGSFRSYAYINAEDQSIKSYAQTANEALDGYRQQLSNRGTNPESTNKDQAKEYSGTIDRLVIFPHDKYNTVNFTLSGSNIMYTITSDTYNKATVMKSGDQIKFSANVDSQRGIGNVVNLQDDNLK
ncbi:hypothetical protein R4B61_06525 [Fructilactobacillus vespulae]|uniref:hypothetical protein n=1 Tax=Fructilactobacillus vespulae TaxID=1249630 RepID=UPI0039B669B8